MKIDIIATKNAPLAIGPYSQAVKFDNFVFASGQLGIDPQTAALVNGNVEDQTVQAFKNIISILRESDSSIDNVIKMTIYIKNLDHFDIVNNVCKQYFRHHFPARCCIEVSRLPKEAEIEIDVISFCDNG